MAKKGLITSLILGAIATLTLGVYTLVTAIIAITTPTHKNVSVAYTSNQKITAFSNYSTEAGNLKIEYENGQEDCLIYNADDNTYSLDTEREFFTNLAVGSAVSVKGVATTDKHGSTTTFNVSIYKQGTGLAENDPYTVANLAGLRDLETEMNATGSLLHTGFINIVDDIDLFGEEWLGLAKDYSKPFAGIINANGKAIKNMEINITEENLDKYIGELGDKSVPGDYYTGLSVGFIRNAIGATINGLSVENARITIAPDVLEKINTDYLDNQSKETLEFVRVGLVVGDARNTTINGEYKVVEYDMVPDTNPESPTFNTEVLTPVKETKYTSNVNGVIDAFAFGKLYGTKYQVNGMGGVAGAISDYSGQPSKVANYAVNVNVNNANDQANIKFGGVAGDIVGNVSATSNNIEISAVDVNFIVEDALFSNTNLIGGVAGSLSNVTLTDVSAIVDVKDSSKRYDQFKDWYQTNGNIDELTQVAGIAAQASKVTALNVTSNAVIDIYAKASAGFVVAEQSTLTNVTTTGRVVGYSVSGLVNSLDSSSVVYTAEAETELVATNVTLSGWRSAGLANIAENSNITATGNVKVIADIYARGDVENINIQNTMYSAGLVGYYYNTNAENYAISGLTVEANINGGIDMAGLVAYMGNQSNTNRVEVKNCVVVANLTSNNSTTLSNTHKAAGAVAVMYGNATLDTVNVTVNFNTNRTEGNKYGAAMFGGAVARIGGENVTINNVTATGSAYINATAYAKTLDEQEFEQILAGGLVGVVASYGKVVEVGSHPIFADLKPELPNATYDDIKCIDTTNGKLVITNNTVAVNIKIDYVKVYNDDANAMGTAGYRARSVGNLIGLLMNGKPSTNDETIVVATEIDLSTNTVTGVVEANANTFAYHNTDKVKISTMGKGSYPDALETPVCVGSSYDLACDEEYTKIIFPTVPSQPEVQE